MLGLVAGAADILARLAGASGSPRSSLRSSVVVVPVVVSIVDVVSSVDVAGATWAVGSLDPPLAASATPTLKAITMAGIVRSFIRVDMEPS